jgi:hypothetical protein
MAMTSFEFEADLISWRGPAPYVFAPVPAAQSAEIRSMAKRLTYGWGVIPVEAEIAGVTFCTSLFPKDGGYLLPLKDRVRHAAGITVGDRIAVTLTVRTLGEP